MFAYLTNILKQNDAINICVILSLQILIRLNNYTFLHLKKRVSNLICQK